MYLRVFQKMRTKKYQKTLKILLIDAKKKCHQIRASLLKHYFIVVAHLKNKTLGGRSA
jgi:hypothetical protein